jgi:hypothetical protein
MAIEHIITQSIDAGGQKISKRLSFTGSREINHDEEGSGAVTNLAIVGFSIDVSVLKDIFFVCDKAISLFFNEASTGTPSKTIVLAANEPFLWHNLSGQTNPWGSTDVTALFVTKAGAGAWRLQIRGLVDATP